MCRLELFEKQGYKTALRFPSLNYWHVESLIATLNCFFSSAVFTFIFNVFSVFLAMNMVPIPACTTSLLFEYVTSSQKNGLFHPHFGFED